MTKLKALRIWLSDKKLAAFIVPSSDPHMSEYSASHWECRQWLTNFTGSAATAVVTKTKAAMWTDSRYFIQASKELDDTCFELQKSGLPETPTIEQWIINNTNEGDKIGVDGRLFTNTQIEVLKKALINRKLVLTEDPFEKIWSDRPSIPINKAFVLDEKYAGETIASKIKRFKPKEGTLILSTLDDIAWLLNIRGTDVEYNSVVIAYVAILASGRVHLFTDIRKFSKQDQEILHSNGVEFQPYIQWEEYLRHIEGVAIVNPARLDSNSWSLLRNPQTEESQCGAVNEAKAIKNSIELDGFRKAMVEDGVALCRFLMWLEQQQQVSEYEISCKLYEFRAQSPLYQGASFENIVAYGANGAMAHYAPNADNSSIIGKDNFLLIDSGGQYKCGTTDITRTYHMGEPSSKQKRDYTNILMGLIDISSVVFPVGTRGAQLDILARQYMWRDGTNYMHGTGHGVGHFLCVHEGPQSIRMNENPVTLKVGMVTSLEPAIYRTNEYGIRSENLVTVVESEHEGYVKFETLTLAPLCMKAIDTGMLLPYHIEWLNAYHAKVYELLSPKLDEIERLWLMEKCTNRFKN